jgi:hypothetical protein
VDVLEDQETRTRLGRLPDQGGQGVAQALLPYPIGDGLRDAIERLLGETGKGAQQGDGTGSEPSATARLPKGLLQLRRARLRGIRHEPTDQTADRVFRGGAEVEDPNQHDIEPKLDRPAARLLDQARLADPRLATQQKGAADSGLGAGNETGHQDAELRLAADHGGRRNARGRRRPRNPPGRQGCPDRALAFDLPMQTPVDRLGDQQLADGNSPKQIGTAMQDRTAEIEPVLGPGHEHLPAVERGSQRAVRRRAQCLLQAQGGMEGALRIIASSLRQSEDERAARRPGFQHPALVTIRHLRDQIPEAFGLIPKCLDIQLHELIGGNPAQAEQRHLANLGLGLGLGRCWIALAGVRTDRMNRRARYPVRRGRLIPLSGLHDLVIETHRFRLRLRIQLAPEQASEITVPARGLGGPAQACIEAHQRTMSRLAQRIQRDQPMVQTQGGFARILGELPFEQARHQRDRQLPVVAAPLHEPRIEGIGARIETLEELPAIKIDRPFKLARDSARSQLLE